MHDSYSVKGPKAYMRCKINIYSCAQIKPSRLPQRPGFIKCHTHHIIMKACLAKYSFPLPTSSLILCFSKGRQRRFHEKPSKGEPPPPQFLFKLSYRDKNVKSAGVKKENDAQLFKAPDPYRGMSVFPQRLNSQDSDGCNVLIMSILEKTVDFLPEKSAI